MNIQLKNMFILILIISAIVLSFVVFYLKQLNATYDILVAEESAGQQMVLKADELRHTSDDLTKYARLYVITKNKTYKDNYYKILDIRNGKTKKPQYYEHEYWDILEPQRSKLHPLQDPIALKDEILSLPYSKYELKRLKEAETNSNDLVNLEVQAFNALEGILQDANQTYAIKLLHSHDYLVAKQKIMLPLNYSSMFLHERNLQNKNEMRQKIEKLFFILFSLVGLSFLIVLVFFSSFYKKILKPIKSLTETILNFQDGKDIKQKITHYNDEVGIMIEQFYTMKTKQDNDFEDMKNLASLDYLTNIYNKRMFVIIAEKLLKISNRTTRDMSLLMVDIDFFKKVNDVYGHLVGDEVLKHLASIVKNMLRESDVFARYGGEEFVILFPNTDKTIAEMLAQKIRKKIEETAYVDEKHNIPITISVGLTSTQDDLYLSNLMLRADKALYLAKNSGRNQVQIG